MPSLRRRRTRSGWIPVAASVALVAGIGLTVLGLTLGRDAHHRANADGAENTGRVPAARIASTPTATPSRTPGSPDATAAGWTPPDARTVAPAPGQVGTDPGGGRTASAARSPLGRNTLPVDLVRLRIPSLGVSAPVINVGTDPDGLLHVPDDPRVLGRWLGGARPGEPYGSTVVIGHVDNRFEEGALFALHTLPVGAHIDAVGADGRSIDYVVTARREVPKTRLVRGLQPFRQDVAARLVVVTCGGSFDRTTRQYADNVVVFAVPEARS